METKRANFRLSHDAVAPSEYKPVYDKLSFPRSIFNSKSRDEEERKEKRSGSIIRRILKPKKENCGGVVNVAIKREAEPLQTIPLNKGSKSAEGGGKLPNAIVNKIFKVFSINETRGVFSRKSVYQVSLLRM